MASVSQSSGIGRRLRLSSSGQRPVIALLESRMSPELSRLVEKHGGNALCIPALREVPALSKAEALDIVDDLIGARHDIVIFMTGVAAALLFEAAEGAGLRQRLVDALASATTVARGPKPTAALRGFGVRPTLTAREPYTSAELLDALSGMPVEGRRVLLFHYGERSKTLAETLRARGARLEERSLYRWLMPEDRRDLECLVASLLSGEVDALMITCQVQMRHLMQVAHDLSLARPLLEALRREVVIAAMGPICRAALQALGLPVHVMPGEPKMGPLVRGLMLHLEHLKPQEPTGESLQHFVN